MSAADKLATRTEARGRATAWHEAGERVVLADGVFELLGVAHARALGRARALGGRLIVALYDDQAAALRLGPGRPLVPAPDRARVCAALRAVDLVVTIAAGELGAVLREMHAIVHARGADGSASDSSLPIPSGITSVDVAEPGRHADLAARLGAGGPRHG